MPKPTPTPADIENMKAVSTTIYKAVGGAVKKLASEGRSSTAASVAICHALVEQALIIMTMEVCGGGVAEEPGFEEAVTLQANETIAGWMEQFTV